MEKCSLTNEEAMTTLSVTDLTRIPALASTYRGLSGELMMSTQDPESLRTVIQGASKAESYGLKSDSYGYSNMIDLGDLVKQTGDVLNQNASKVTQALKDAVKYEIHGDNRSSANGLSVFYPIGVDKDDIEKYKDCTDNIAFLGFTNALFGDFDTPEWEKMWESAWEEAYSGKDVKEGKYDSYFNNGQSIASDYVEELSEEDYTAIENVKPVQQKDYDLKFTLDVDQEGYNQLKITSGLDMVSTVNFMLYYEDPESGEYIYLGSDNDMNSDYDKGVFTEQFEGTWITIGGEFVCAELLEENEKYNLYTIPVKLNGEEKLLKAVYDYDQEKFSILGAYDGLDDESGYASRNVEQLKNGDKIQFLFYVFDPESEEKEGNDELVPMSEITWSDDTVMEDSEIGDGKLAYMFYIKSVFGDENSSDPIYLKIENGEITTN